MSAGTLLSLLEAGWRPWRWTSLPPIDAGFIWSTQQGEMPVPSCGATAHRYVAKYGDSETLYWRPMTPAERAATRADYIANGWCLPIGEAPAAEVA